MMKQVQASGILPVMGGQVGIPLPADLDRLIAQCDELWAMAKHFAGADAEDVGWRLRDTDASAETAIVLLGKLDRVGKCIGEHFVVAQRRDLVAILWARTMRILKATRSTDPFGDQKWLTLLSDAELLQATNGGGGDVHVAEFVKWVQEYR